MLKKLIITTNRFPIRSLDFKHFNANNYCVFISFTKCIIASKPSPKYYSIEK